MKRLPAYFAGLGKKLLELRDTPHAIAGGVAIGMFIGFTPLFGIKTLLCLALAYLLRCSKIAAVIAVSLHDIVAPIWLILPKVEYDIGLFILSGFHETPSLMNLNHFHLEQLWKWTIFRTVGVPMLVGSLVISAPIAAISYACMLALLQYREKKRLAHEGEHSL